MWLKSGNKLYNKKTMVFHTSVFIPLAGYLSGYKIIFTFIMHIRKNTIIYDFKKFVSTYM